MNAANLELCKELFKLSGWDETEFSWYTHYDDASIEWTGLADGACGVFACPAYDLSYLLRKFIGKGGIEIRYGDQGCIASSQLWSVSADTPEDATCNLAIELFKKGILKRE